jgi:hypothetical protein
VGGRSLGPTPSQSQVYGGEALELGEQRRFMPDQAKHIRLTINHFKLVALD